MKRNILFLSIITFMFFSCSKKTTTTIVPVGEARSLSARGMIYSLPKTNLKVKVEALHTSYVPGPYAEYAQKFLGIANVGKTLNSSWEISSVRVIPYQQPDMDAMFAVEPADDFNVDFLRLAKEGLVIPISQSYFQSVEQSITPKPSMLELSDFYDLSPSPFIVAERTTHYSRVFQDSAYVRVPVHKTVVIEKSLEDKAREAAEFIFSLRKRRYELLSGDADFVAEGKAVGTVLDEISRLESEYLSLFVGKVQKSSVIHQFDYTPTSDEDGASILFRFSNSKGVLPSSNLSGSPVLISVKDDTKWQGVELFSQLSTHEEVQLTNAVFYRIPVPANVRIYNAQSEFFSQILTIYQFGPMVRMPSRFIVYPDGIIEFPKNDQE